MDERENLLRFHEIDHPCLSWDTFCDLLDGVPWDVVAPRLPHLTQHDPAHSGLARLRKCLGGPGQYFHEANSLRCAREIFWLKLSLFDRLCRQVASIHVRIRQPLLTLDPAHILIRPPDETHSYVPVRWGCLLTILGGEEVSRPIVDDMPSEMASGLHTAPQGIDPTYASPFVREWPLGREASGTALIQSADRIPNDEDATLTRGLVRVHVVADEIAAHTFSTHDVFRLILSLNIGKNTEVWMWARKVDVPERGIVLSGVTDGLSPEMWTAFEAASRHPLSNARAMVYRRYTASSDLYSLGMLLLRALLGSDPRRWERVMATHSALLERLPPVVQGVDPSDVSVLHARIRERLCEWQDLFVQPDIADDLWWDALTLALRATSSIPGFSYAVPLSSEACVSDSHGVDGLSQDAAHLAGRARVDLFEADERDRTIRTACDRMLAELEMG